MIVSSFLTVSQITFILRIAIQILEFIGPILISLIIFATVSRVAPIDTHSLINRIVGASTATKSTVSWIMGRLRHKHADPTPSFRFFFLLLLSLHFTIFVSLSDIGFLGFSQCPIPVYTVGFPASISSEDAARALILSNMVNGTNPAEVKVARCESTTVHDFGDGVFLNSCTSWQNSTYADAAMFHSLNQTDTDTMMPRQLTHLKQESEVDSILSYFYVGPDTQRVLEPTITKTGLAVLPHEGGVRIVMGVPKLAYQEKVKLSKVMAVEVEVGCMDLGISDIETADSTQGMMVLSTNGTWRAYTGPAYLEEPLSKTVDDLRTYFQPFFDPSTLDAYGLMSSNINASNIQATTAAVVAPHDLPTLDFSLSPANLFMGNCTQRIEKVLQIISDNRTEPAGDMCGLLGVGGSFSFQGREAKMFQRMVCATTTQINMVDANISVDAYGTVSANITQLPSDIHYTSANYLPQRFNDFFNASTVVGFDPYRRYTLSDNPNGSKGHFIHQPKMGLSIHSTGIGSGGNTISSMGSIILGGGLVNKTEYNALRLLDDGLNIPVFEPPTVVKWVGEVGASFIVASLGYNGWAALQSKPVTVEETVLGVCYNLYFALGFAPFVVSVIILLGWMVAGMLGRSWFETEVLDKGYAGVTPYTATVCPGADPKTKLLAWEAQPEPHLQVIEKGYPVMGDPNATALEYLKSASSYE